MATSFREPRMTASDFGSPPTMGGSHHARNSIASRMRFGVTARARGTLSRARPRRRPAKPRRTPTEA
jgi:hypothetical protein